jgi:hypothetical protein
LTVVTENGSLQTVEFWFIVEPLCSDAIAAGKSVEKIATGWLLLVVLMRLGWKW